MRFENPTDLVQQDVLDGLAALFPSDEGIRGGEFRIPEHFAGRNELRSPDDEIVAVPWLWVGRVQNILGMRVEDGRPIEISGVTFVSESAETGEPEFRRYVDWLGAFAQVGVGVFPRPVIDDGGDGGGETQAS